MHEGHGSLGRGGAISSVTCPSETKTSARRMAGERPRTVLK